MFLGCNENGSACCMTFVNENIRNVQIKQKTERCRKERGRKAPLQELISWERPFHNSCVNNFNVFRTHDLQDFREKMRATRD